MRFIFAVLFVLICDFAAAQVLQATAPFSTGTTYLEPDDKQEAVKISANEFVTITKVRGSYLGPSDFMLEKFDLALKPLFKIPLTAQENEDYEDLYFNGKELILLSVIHKTDIKLSTFKAYAFDPATGAKQWDKVLDKLKITDWVGIKYKGAVKQSFHNAIGSSLTKNYVTPLQYQYDVKFSPDSSKILSYIYDYGQKNLLAKVKIYDKEFNVIDSAMVSIDNNFINYGIFPNNKGEIFIVNVDRLGRMVIIKYVIKTKEIKLLDIQYSSSNRESLRVQIFGDDIVYVANINTNNGKLVGVMYSKFNFVSSLVEKINFYELSEGLKQTINATRHSSKKAEENWLNYEITDFILNQYEKIILVLEKKEINGPGYEYDAEAINEHSNWMERDVRIHIEGVIFFSFNNEDEIMWENFYMKSQNTDIISGFSTGSFSLDNSSENTIRMVYASSDNSAGIYTVINLVEWDAFNGNKLRDIPLQNDEKLTLIRQYSLWWEDKLIIVGRKGMLGKKSSINLYKI
ncbi:MAG TPA: hypothetical protein VNW99_03875 [Cytophagaceae bacterium]|jgi:hypothetical protein|nr:hypothetical protein [Cytophagaceae bacterium]